MSQVNSIKSALTDKTIKSFLFKHGIKANILTLEEFNQNPDKAEKYFVIFTGNTANRYNTTKEKKITKNGKTTVFPPQPLTQHWMCGVGDKIFDSYGYGDDYEWPDNISFITCHPSRLQEFDSDVCGEYVLSFLWYINKINTDLSNVGFDYSKYFGFSTNRFENDNIVLEWFKKEK